MALGADLEQVRMYEGYRSVIKGMGRGLAPAGGGGRLLLAASWGWPVIAYTMPVLLVRRSKWWRAAAAMCIAERLILEAKTGGRDGWSAAFVGLSPLAAGPVVAQAMRRRQRGRGDPIILRRQVPPTRAHPRRTRKDCAAGQRPIAARGF